MFAKIAAMVRCAWRQQRVATLALAAATALAVLGLGARASRRGISFARR